MPPIDQLAFEHVILMRFNVRTKHAAEARDSAIRSERDWLDRRFDLFERICLPTIVGQSAKNFSLHVYFDSQTADKYIDRFKFITVGLPCIVLNTCDFFDAEVASAGVSRRLAGVTRFVLTTRLDNDDGLHCDFVRNVQAEVRQGGEAINFPYGLVLAEGAMYRSKQDSNAFISVLEPRDDLKTVLQVSHNQLSKRFVIRNVTTKPMWLQHVHGGNVSNKIRGKRLPASALPEGFDSIKLNSLIKPIGNPTVAFENATAGTMRAGRDLVAKALRRIRGR